MNQPLALSCEKPFEPSFDSARIPSDFDHCIVLHKDQLLLAGKEGDWRFPQWQDLEFLEASLVQQRFIGLWNGIACYAIALNTKHTIKTQDLLPQDARALIPSMSSATFHAVARARQLLRFYSSHRYCSQCGKSLEDSAKEFARICNTCEREIYPVIAPAIIVSVLREGKILLAHNKNYTQPMHSLIAGFVESGETLEQTVAREVREEVGIEIKDIRYLSSQPWPFPNSLMLGFTANYAGGEIQVDGNEIDHADWYEPQHMPDIPRPGSISRLLIDRWNDSFTA